MSTKKKTSKPKGDQKNRKPIIVSAAVLVLALIAGAVWLVFFNKPEPEPEPEPEPTALDLPVGSLGYDFLTSVINGEEIDGWRSSDSEPQVTFDEMYPELDCSIERPLSHTATAAVDSGERSLTLQTVAPGTGLHTLEGYATDLSNCLSRSLDVEETTIDDTHTWILRVDDSRAILLLGDVLIGVTDDSDPSGTLNEVAPEFSSALNDSQCLALSVTENDWKRNQFIAEDDYTGYLVNDTLETTIDVENLPTVQVPELREVSNPDAEEPEGPLTNGIPEETDSPDQPSTLPTAPETTDEPFTTRVVLQVRDVEGPGCGWAWSEWETPTETDEEISERNDAVIDEAQTQVDREASGYVQAHVNWAANITEVQPEIAAWNRWVVQTDRTHARWEWLEEQREEVREDWEDFVERYNYWYNFDDEKQQARNDYRDAQNACRTAQRELEEWEREYEDGSEGGGNTGVPPRPDGCDEEPEEPAILDQDKPRQPIPPDLPQDVTIPDSWPQTDG